MAKTATIVNQNGAKNKKSLIGTFQSFFKSGGTAVKAHNNATSNSNQKLSTPPQGTSNSINVTDQSSFQDSLNRDKQQPVELLNFQKRQFEPPASSDTEAQLNNKANVSCNFIDL